MEMLDGTYEPKLKNEKVNDEILKQLFGLK
jgi:hypothetical protein